MVQAGEVLPRMGKSSRGIASVDEKRGDRRSAPVVLEAGGDRSAVTGNARLLSDWLVVRDGRAGPRFLERMIAMVEGAKRQKTPNRLHSASCCRASLSSFSWSAPPSCRFRSYSARAAGRGAPLSITVLVALLVCLIPTTIGGLLSAIGIAGMDRMIRRNVVATSERAVEAAGDVDVLLLDKTGTITLGNRQAVEFVP